MKLWSVTVLQGNSIHLESLTSPLCYVIILLTEGIDVAASTTQGQEALPVTAGNGSPNLIYIRMDDRFSMSPGGGYFFVLWPL